MISLDRNNSTSPFGPDTPPNLQFFSISDDAHGLVYRLKEPHSDKIVATVRFNEVLAYRVADEGVLLDYWARKLANTSHLVWELKNSEFLAWIEAISLRAHAAEDGIRHFIVVSASTCLEVLSTAEPSIEVG